MVMEEDILEASNEVFPLMTFYWEFPFLGLKIRVHLSDALPKIGLKWALCKNQKLLNSDTCGRQSASCLLRRRKRASV